MQPIQKRTLATAIAVLLAPVLPVLAQDSTLQKRLESEFALTSINAEGGVVVQGASLTLKKSGLTAGATAGCTNDYKDGKIALASKDCRASGVAKKIGSIPLIGGYIPGNAQAVMQTTRPFAVGEKFYVTQITATDGVAFTLISDAIDNTTYKAEMRFKTRDLAQVDRMMAEVFNVTAANTPQETAQQPARQLLPVQNVLPELPVPPPPDAAAPPSTQLALGQTIAQVVGFLGQPVSIADAGPKKIYIYKDWKVTFIDGKVADVE